MLPCGRPGQQADADITTPRRDGASVTLMLRSAAYESRWVKTSMILVGVDRPTEAKLNSRTIGILTL